MDMKVKKKKKWREKKLLMWNKWSRRSLNKREFLINNRMLKKDKDKKLRVVISFKTWKLKNQTWDSGTKN